mgnify:CR=1 FL=1
MNSEYYASVSKAVKLYIRSTYNNEYLNYVGLVIKSRVSIVGDF